MSGRRVPLRERVALAIALAWSAGLLVGAVLAPVYQSQTETSAGAVTQGSASLVEENGPGVLLVVGIPLVAVVIVGFELWRRRPPRGAGPIAWTCAGLLAGVNLLAMLSIGPFIIPVTACLFIACVTRHAKGRADAGGRVFPT